MDQSTRSDKGTPPGDKLLFTPGPLTTSASVKRAMLRDLGARDAEFVGLVAWIRGRLLELAGTSKERGFEAVPMQGSGTFGLESLVGTVVPPAGGLLVCVNGAYGRRLVEIGRRLGIRTEELACSEDRRPDPAAVERALADDRGLTHLALVHCETTTGIMNPVRELGAIARRLGRDYLVDSMSAFGAVPVDVEADGIDHLVSSANKCIEGVPGFSFVVSRRSKLEAAEGLARSVSLDLVAQWRGLEASGQFRFTPPTHALLAFGQALRELEDEGGVAARGGRYRANQRRLAAGMRALGFRELLDPQVQGPVITTFHHLDDPRFDFEALYRRLSERGFVIYPGKLGELPCFRIGTCGRLGPPEIDRLLAGLRATLLELGVALPESA